MICSNHSAVFIKSHSTTALWLISFLSVYLNLPGTSPDLRPDFVDALRVLFDILDTRQQGRVSYETVSQSISTRFLSFPPIFLLFPVINYRGQFINPEESFFSPFLYNQLRGRRTFRSPSAINFRLLPPAGCWKNQRQLGREDVPKSHHFYD